MNDQTLKDRENQMLAVCPLPVDFDEDTFKIQIQSADGKTTQWIEINGFEFHTIERVLLNGFGM